MAFVARARRRLLSLGRLRSSFVQDRARFRFVADHAGFSRRPRWLGPGPGCCSGVKAGPVYFRVSLTGLSGVFPGSLARLSTARSCFLRRSVFGPYVICFRLAAWGPVNIMTGPGLVVEHVWFYRRRPRFWPGPGCCSAVCKEAGLISVRAQITFA